MTESNSPVPIWFWIVAGIALVWNALGIMAYIADVSQTPEQIAAQSQVIQELYAARPAWSVAAFAIAVFVGTLGSLALLLRKSWAVSLLIVSLVAVIAQQYYSFGIAEMHKHIQGSTTFPAIVFLIAVFLVWFARFSRSKGWLS